MISLCRPYCCSALSCLLCSHHVLLFRLVASDCLSCSAKLGRSVLSSSLALSLSPCRSHPVFIFCLAILLAFCLLFSAMRQLLSDIGKLGCGCHTRAPKPMSVTCVCRGAEARTVTAVRRRWKVDETSGTSMEEKSFRKSIPTLQKYWKSEAQRSTQIVYIEAGASLALLTPCVPAHGEKLNRYARMEMRSS